ncbi:MAG: MFS transporter [Candidatus Thorarchaeota archaeon]|nr:MFS transporter [Candidatus Thorarchaeota archaeon]
MDNDFPCTADEHGQEPSSEDDGQGIYQVWMLAISLSFLQIGFGIITPIFPFYIDELGVGGVELGVLAASFALTRILLAGPLGGSSDKYGRKPILVFALLGFALANFIYAFAENIFVMIGARAVEGAVSAGFYPAANAFVSDVTDPENRGTAMGYLSMGNMVGFVLGPALGGILAQFLGIRLPFIVAGLVTLLTLVVLYILVQEPTGARGVESRRAKPKASVLEVLGVHKREYGVLALAMFANMFAIGILEVAFLLDAVQRLEIQPWEIGLFFGVLGIITIIGNVAFGKLSDRSGRRWLIVLGSVFGALSLFMFMATTDTAGFYLSGAVLGIAMSMRGPTIQAMIADLTDSRAYGVVMGGFGAVSNGAYVIGPILGGVMYDTTGTSVSSLGVAGVVSLLGAAAAAIGLPSDRPSKDSCPLPQDALKDY